MDTDRSSPEWTGLEAEKARRVKARAGAHLEDGLIACYLSVMDKNRIIATLLENRAELERKGVLHAALFGSMARGDATGTSDIDIMIDLDPESEIGVFEYVGLKEFIAGLFDSPVDVVNRNGLKAYVKPAVLNDAVDVF
jgi:uncharacterized protein